MGNRNVRVDAERFELSLGGLQIAAIVVGALGVLGLVFFLGFHAGERLGQRRAEAAHPVSLPELDAVTAAQKPLPANEVTFANDLPRAKPPAAPPPAPPKPAKPPEAAAAPPPAPPSAADAGNKPSKPPAVEPTAAPAKPPAASASWCIQLGASQNRAEAEELARRLQRLGSRIEEVDIPGKGHYFRVRVGRYADRATAERARSDVSRETGLTGNLIPPGG
jgi:cell division septation protein DedD